MQYLGYTYIKKLLLIWNSNLLDILYFIWPPYPGSSLCASATRDSTEHWLFLYGTFCFYSRIRKCNLFIDLTEGECLWNQQLVRGDWLLRVDKYCGEGKADALSWAQSGFQNLLVPLCGLSFPGPEVGLSGCYWRGQERNCLAREGIYGYVGLFQRFAHSFSPTKQLVAGSQRWMVLGAALEALQRRGDGFGPQGQRVMPASKPVFIVE